MFVRPIFLFNLLTIDQQKERISILSQNQCALLDGFFLYEQMLRNRPDFTHFTFCFYSKKKI